MSEPRITRNNLFPTLVYSVDNVVPEADRKVIVETIATRPEQQSTLDIFNDAAFKPLVTAIAGLAQTWLQDHCWEVERLIMTSMWFTKLQAGEFHRPHTHGNNVISGVYYPEKCESDGIVFDDPRPQAHVISPYALKLNPLNAPNWSFPSEENSLLLFPSWLKHYVPPAKNARVSIAFNLMLTGMVGRDSDLQASEFS